MPVWSPDEFFPLTGSRPIMGRLLTASDDEPHSPATVVVTQSFLGQDPFSRSADYRQDSDPEWVRYEWSIGVLARDPGFFSRPVDYYLPLRPTAAQAAKRDAHGSMRALALLKPGVTLSQARSDLNTIMQRLAQADPGPEDDHRALAEFLTENEPAMSGMCSRC